MFKSYFVNNFLKSNLRYNYVVLQGGIQLNFRFFIFLLEKFVLVGENVLKNYVCKINYSCLFYSRFICIIFWICFIYVFEWILKNNYNLFNFMYYLDDYFIVGFSNFDVFVNNIQVQVVFRLEIFLVFDTLEGFIVFD